MFWDKNGVILKSSQSKPKQLHLKNYIIAYQNLANVEIVCVCVCVCARPGGHKCELVCVCGVCVLRVRARGWQVREWMAGV